jgi:hypothetical protein
MRIILLQAGPAQVENVIGNCPITGARAAVTYQLQDPTGGRASVVDAGPSLAAIRTAALAARCVVRGRANPGEIERLLRDTATLDGERVRIGFRKDPGQAGTTVRRFTWHGGVAELASALRRPQFDSENPGGSRRRYRLLEVLKNVCSGQRNNCLNAFVLDAAESAQLQDIFSFSLRVGFTASFLNATGGPDRLFLANSRDVGLLESRPPSSAEEHSLF